MFSRLEGVSNQVYSDRSGNVLNCVFQAKELMSSHHFYTMSCEGAVEFTKFPELYRTTLVWHRDNEETDSCITQLEAQGPSRACNESEKEEEEE